ncbi:hypothetical protein AVEN_224720-1 [Araneus ventricosus]|uniref:Uncharacterized protein n=1 Tax=Araneus ventricosus TaxID=182803 RepID=A0A4Y2U1C1_ARAVE|nr:hypothetical protein AVEN_224720-1 [Araneus ventricosus]
MEQEIAEIHSQSDVTEENHNKSSIVATRESNISPLPPTVERNTISLRNREVLRDVEPKDSGSAELVYSCNTEIPIKTELSRVPMLNDGLMR